MFVESMFTWQIFATAPRTKGPNPDVYNSFRKGGEKVLTTVLSAFVLLAFCWVTGFTNLTTKVKDC